MMDPFPNNAVVMVINWFTKNLGRFMAASSGINRVRGKIEAAPAEGSYRGLVARVTAGQGLQIEQEMNL